MLNLVADLKSKACFETTSHPHSPKYKLPTHYEPRKLNYKQQRRKTSLPLGCIVNKNGDTNTLGNSALWKVSTFLFNMRWKFTAMPHSLGKLKCFLAMSFECHSKAPLLWKLNTTFFCSPGVWYRTQNAYLLIQSPPCCGGISKQHFWILAF